MGRFAAALRAPLLFAAVFSLLGNLLALIPALFMLQVYDRVLSSRSIETLVMLSLIVAAALLAFVLLDNIRLRLLSLAGVRLEDMASGPLLREVIRVSAVGGAGGSGAAGGKPNSVQLAGHALRDLRQVRQFMSTATLGTLFDLPWSPVFLLLIWLFHPLLGMVALAGVGVLLVLTWLDDRLIRNASDAAGVATRHAGELLDTALASAQAVQVMGMAAAVDARWRASLRSANDHGLVVSRRSGAVLSVSKFTRQALQALMLALGAWLVIRQQASPGVMIAATILLGRAMSPIETAISGWRGLVQTRAAWRRLDDLLGSMAARPVPLALPAPTGALLVERLVFGPDAGAPVIRGVGFALAPGEQLGLIGPSGAGKSTLGRLLLGLLAPRAGLVRLDGADIRGWDAQQLGPHLGYMPQDLTLFDGSVAMNIARLADPARNPQAVVDAACMAGAHEMILGLPQGYDTVVGARGLPLSAGQRQRVALARALYGNPSLLVLDEPNANLDTEGEIALLRALTALKARGATVVLITHRPALLVGADKVLVLQAGAVSQFGPRDEVLGRVSRAGAAVPTLIRGGVKQ